MNVANEKRSWEQRMAVVGLGLAVLLFSGFMMAPESSLLLKISKSIDVFGRVYKEGATSYVDEIDPEKFMEAGIDGMLETLDPYTVYIDKENGDEVDLMTNGKYGGIGHVGTRDGGARHFRDGWLLRPASGNRARRPVHRNRGKQGHRHEAR
jgi:carboxyl-terminal processing protease